MGDWLDRYDSDVRDELRALADRLFEESSLAGGRRICYWTLYREQASVCRRMIAAASPDCELNLSLVAKMMEAEADKVTKEFGAAITDLLVYLSASRRAPDSRLRAEASVVVENELRRILRILGANSGLVHHSEAIFAASMREAEFTMAKLYGIDIEVAALRMEDLVDVESVLLLTIDAEPLDKELVALRDSRVVALRVVDTDEGTSL